MPGHRYGTVARTPVLRLAMSALLAGASGADAQTLVVPAGRRVETARSGPTSIARAVYTCSYTASADTALGQPQ